MNFFKSPIIRPLVFTVGILSLILGVVGLFLPLLPTTPFILLSAWCFLNSSPRAHAYLIRQPWIGKILSDWEQRGAISKTAKFQALFMMSLSVVVIWLTVAQVQVRVGVSFFLLIVAIFILTRPE